MTTPTANSDVTDTGTGAVMGSDVPIDDSSATVAPAAVDSAQPMVASEPPTETPAEPVMPVAPAMPAEPTMPLGGPEPVAPGTDTSASVPTMPAEDKPAESDVPSMPSMEPSMPSMTQTESEDANLDTEAVTPAAAPSMPGMDTASADTSTPTMPSMEPAMPIAPAEPESPAPAADSSTSVPVMPLETPAAATPVPDTSDQQTPPPLTPAA